MSAPQRSVSLTPLAIVEPVRQKFLWRPYIPLNVATALVGRGGEGKSTYSLHLAAKITRGELHGEFYGKPQTVLLVGHEDGLSTIVVPRLMAAGADMNRVQSFMIRVNRDGLETHEVPSLADDLAHIREAITTTGAAVIIIDPLASMMEGANLDKASDVRRLMNPLTAMADELGIAILCLMHFRKGQGDTRDMMSGSHSFRDAVRSVLLFATDDETGQRIVTADKANYTTSGGESFAFELVSTDITLRNGEHTTVARVHELGASQISVNDIVNREPEKPLGEEIREVVDCVNRHPEGVSPADIAAEIDQPANSVRSYLVRAEKRGLITKQGYGKYFPSATDPQSSCAVAPVALVALDPSPTPPNQISATSATEAAVQQQTDGVALCRVCEVQLTSPDSIRRGICSKPDGEHNEARSLWQVVA